MFSQLQCQAFSHHIQGCLGHRVQDFIFGWCNTNTTRNVHNSPSFTISAATTWNRKTKHDYRNHILYRPRLHILINYFCDTCSTCAMLKAASVFTVRCLQLNKNTSNKIRRHTNIQPGKPICFPYTKKPESRADKIESTSNNV